MTDGRGTAPERLDSPGGGKVLLALETASFYGSVALLAEERCRAELSFHSGTTHSRRLLAAIDQLMQETAVSWEEIGAIAVSLGPGSFTGLRIGLSTAKGLVLATGRPLVGISTLDGLAAQVAVAERQICAVLDARKKEVYAAFYRGEAGRPVRQSDYLVLPPAALAAMISEPTILVGDGAEMYGDFFRETLGSTIQIAAPEMFFCRAAGIGFLALEQWREGNFLDQAAAVPIYVRASEAELKFG